MILSVMAMRECLSLRSKCVYEITVLGIRKIGIVRPEKGE